jgi:hypothetical protein
MWRLTMKKLFLVLSIVSLLLACNNGDMEKEDPNPFVGTWEAESGTKIVFSKTIVTNYDPSGDIYWKGSYTYDDEYITITITEHDPTYEWGSPLVPWYSFEDQILIFGGLPFNKV